MSMILPTTQSTNSAQLVAPPPRLEEVAERIFAYVQPDGGWCVSNSGILLNGDSVAVVDTASTEARARALRAAVASLSPLEPRALVNTHHHGDHTFGNFVFAPSASIIGHELARTEMAEKGMGLQYVWPDANWGEIELILPWVTFQEQLTLHVGELRVELLYVGPAHTNNDVVAWIPEHRLLFAGDVLMSGCTPFFLMGSLEGSLRAVARLRALGAQTIVGGHGPVCGPEIFDATESYLLRVRDIARGGVSAGLTPLQAALETSLGDFTHLRDPERLVANLHRAYSEELGEPLGKAIRSGPVFAEMMEYNGGQPLTCLA